MSNGGIYQQNSISHLLLKDAIPNAGYVLMPGTADQTAGLNLKVKLNNGSTEPIGIAYTSTKHPVTGVAQSGVQVGVAALIEGTEIEVPLVDNNAEISQWEEIEVAAGVRLTPRMRGQAEIIGRALEAKDASVGGYIRIRVSKYYATA